MKHSKETLEKFFRGENSHLWKGENAQVAGKHNWILRHFKKTGKCEFCGKRGRTDWSNKKHTYRRVREDWQELCRSCHQKYDIKNGHPTP